MSKLIVDTVENTAGTFTSGIDSLGPSTTYGAVGTYVGGFVNAGASVFVDNNTNKAGSSIQIYSGNTSDGGTFYVTNVGYLKSAGLSGTWKCVSAYEASDPNYLWGSIWMRIS